MSARRVLETEKRREPLWPSALDLCAATATVTAAGALPQPPQLPPLGQSLLLRSGFAGFARTNPRPLACYDRECLSGRRYRPLPDLMTEELVQLRRSQALPLSASR